MTRFIIESIFGFEKFRRILLIPGLLRGYDYHWGYLWKSPDPNFLSKNENRRLQEVVTFFVSFRVV